MYDHTVTEKFSLNFPQAAGYIITFMSLKILTHLHIISTFVFFQQATTVAQYNIPVCTRARVYHNCL